MRRLFDISFSMIVLMIFSPLMLTALVIVYLWDRETPIFFSNRIGLNGRPFKMLKIRTMVTDAEKYNIDSTKRDDPRITPVGHIIRRLKLDEFPQFVNVLLGQLSLVGPRPNVQRETDIYTQEESRLLSVKPGVTDLSSIIFFDLAQILENSKDANIAYNQLVRPWKSRLGLLYIDHKSFLLDMYIIFLTALSFVCRRCSLNLCASLIARLGGDDNLLEICKRTRALRPYPPPGSKDIVNSRDPAGQL